jgi:hypothetical protein
MNVMDIVKNVGPVVAVVGIGYAIITQAGWVVKRADAQDMIEIAVQQSAAQNNQALLDEVKARQRADLQLKLDLANQKIGPLLDNPDPTPAEEFSIGQLTQEIERLNTELASLD